jgi:hypothetical protein
MSRQTDALADVTVDLQPKQAELLEVMQNGTATTIGYGGSRGGGKSHGGRSAIYLRRLWYPKTNALIFRRTWGEVFKNHLRPLLTEHPELLQHYRSQEKTVYIPQTQSEITFGTAEHEQDILAFHGLAFADILVDESQRCTQYMLEKLKESNRCTTNEDITPKMIQLMNPGDLGHAYNKRVFIDREYIENEEPDDFAFVEAHGWDNVMWVLKALKTDGLTAEDFYGWNSEKRFEYFVTRSNYGKKLNSLPDSERRAQLLGDWNVYAGQFFNMLRRDIHYIRPFQPPQDWRVMATIDWGQRSVLEVQAYSFNGNVYNFGEVFTEHQAATPRAIEMAEFLIANKFKKLQIQYDTNMDLDLSEVGYEKVPVETFRKVFAQTMGDDAPTLFRVSKRSVDERHYRELANDVMKDYLDWQKGKDGSYTHKARFFVTQKCPKLWESLNSLQHPDNNPTGRDFARNIGLQDPYDAAKMNLLAMLPPSELKRAHPKQWYEEVVEANKPKNVRKSWKDIVV